MVIFPLAPDQTIAQMWSNGARGGIRVIISTSELVAMDTIRNKTSIKVTPKEHPY